jgi:hypothetical protein
VAELNLGVIKPRGMVFTADNKKFWAKVNNNLPANTTPNTIPKEFTKYKSDIRIQSYTYRRKEPELWFTGQHIHDMQAVKNSILYLLPGYSYLVGYTKNLLVNRDRDQQDERGIKLIEFDATNY